jgi:hypothetical protein
MVFPEFLRARIVMLLATLVPTLGVPLQAAVTIGGAGGLTVSVDPSGSYDISIPGLAWDFGGTAGYPLSNLAVASGTDTAGTFSEISFDFKSDAPHHAAIRSYWDHRAVLFSVSNSAASANAIQFPNLSRYPPGLSHVNFCGMFAFPSFYGWAEESPWVFFDSAANAFVLSPASNFTVASTAWGPKGELSSGISPKIASLPEGFSHRVLLVVENGINQAFDTWGKMMTDLYGKTRPAADADSTLNRIGYWTDAGSTYYYNTLPSTSYSDTLMAAKAGFEAQGISLGYMQLDSWFYPKGPSADWTDGGGGIDQYMAAPALFESGLARFQQALGPALVTHARWIDPASPYRQQYKFSGDVSIDPLYWTEIARYLANAGVVAYEQDWLSNQAQAAFNLTDEDDFLDSMAAAMALEHIDMQYCMPTPRHFLKSVQYANLTSIRASGDRFDRTRWTSFLYASRLASALGIWPFTDVFMSSETENLLLATLSAGPVGVGDPVGSLNGANLLRAVRADGVIVKPDAPLTPLDRSYLGDAHADNAPLIASTYTDFGGLRSHYVFAYSRAADTQVAFSPSSFGLNQPAYLYNYFDGTGSVVTPETAVTAAFQDAWVYLVAAPIGPSGMAILGDTGHFVPMGKKRVTAFEDDGTVRLTVAFAQGEASRTLRGYSPSAPKASAVRGAVGAVTYDSGTGQFSVAVGPGGDGTASIRIVRPPADSPGKTADRDSSLRSVRRR